MKKYNEWILEALSKRGVIVNTDGTLDICFFGNKVQHIKNLDAAIRQQGHIIEQQKEEQEENKEIGLLMRRFHETVCLMTKMSLENLSEKECFFSKLESILKLMSKKREDLRKDGYTRLQNVMKMLEKKNLPAANLASQAALDRMRRRWLVNEKVIDKSLIRLEALKQLK